MKTDRAIDIIRDMKRNIRSVIKNCAFNFGWTFEKCLDWRQEHIFDNPYWQKLPRWAKSEIQSYFECVFDDLIEKLVWTHVLDGKRILSGSPETKNRDKDIFEQHNERVDHFSCHCYVHQTNDRIIFLPFNSENRKQEVTFGRLTQDDIKSRTLMGTELLFKGNRRNGSQCLAKVELL